MRRTFARGLCLALLIVAAGAPLLRAQPPASLELVATIPLPKVSGRIDHLAYDAARQIRRLGHTLVKGSPCCL